jgi:hypothetical protein
VTIEPGRAALVDLPTVALARVATALLVGFRVNSLWLIVDCCAIGWAARLCDDASPRRGLHVRP